MNWESLMLSEQTREAIECLIVEFERLDTGEQTRNEAGRAHGHLGAEHGRKGGRPKKSTASSHSDEQAAK